MGDSLTISQRVRAAWSALVKGSIEPFNKIPFGDGAVGAKLSQPYAKSVWVMRAIKTVAGPIAAVPLRFTLDRRGGEQAFNDTALTAWWENPCRGLRGFAPFIEAGVGWRKMAGESFWIFGDDWLVPFPETGVRSQLILARPDRMRHVVEGGVLLGWEFRDDAGRAHRLLPEQVIQRKLWNPFDEWRGLGELEAALIAAETEYLTGVYARNLMRQSGDRGPYIVAKSGVVTDPQREQIIADLKAKRAAALRGEFRPAFFTGDIEVKDPALQPLDAAVLAGRLQNRHEIFIAFGVPASRADVAASYSIGSASDTFRLIEETCMPEAQDLADAVEIVARRQTGKQVYAWFDWDQHSTMQAVRRERWDTAVKAHSLGVPLKVINDNLGLGLPPVKGWEQGYLPFSVTPVGADLPEEDPALAEPTDTPSDESASEDAIVGEMVRALRAGSARGPEAKGEGQEAHRCACGCGDLSSPEVVAKLSKVQREQAVKRRQTIAAYRTAFNRELMLARAETLQRIEQGAKILGALGTTTRAAAADLVFDRARFRKGLLARLRQTAQAALNDAGDQLWKEIGKDDPFTMAPAKVLEFVAARENRITGAADHVWESVRDELQAGLDAGDSIKELSDRIRAEFNGLSRERAQVIAQTETAAAYGFARDDSMKRAGVKRKAWLTSGNPNVRSAHAQAGEDYSEANAIPVDEPFIVDGEALMFPGDPKGSPGNVINCHCISIAVVDEG